MRRLFAALLALVVSLSTTSVLAEATAAPFSSLVLPAQVTAAEPTYDDVRSIVIIPDVEGVSYTVDGVPAPAGEFQVTPAAPSGSAVLITATRASDGMESSWTHQFPFVLTPNAVTFRDSDSSIRTPAHWGVTYWLIQPDGVERKMTSNSYTLIPEYKGQEVTVEARSNNLRQVVLTGNTTWKYTFPNVATAPTWNDLESTIEIPDLAGITYTVNGEAAPAGTFQVTPSSQGGILATVVATRAADGFTWTWSHHFPHVLVPSEPQFEDDQYRIKTPSHWGVTYWLVKPDGTEQAMPSNSYVLAGEFEGQTVRVEARANSTRQTLLTGTTSWTHTFPARAEAPTFLKESASVQIPDGAGVEYSIDGQKVAPGIHRIDTSQAAVTVSVTALETATGVTSVWSEKLPQLLTPDSPKFDDTKHLIWAPSHMHVTFVATVSSTGEEIVMTSRSWNGSWKQFNGESVTVEARENNDNVLLVGTTTWKHTFAERPDYSLATGDEFNGPGIARGWNVYDNYARSGSIARKENLQIVKTADGTSALEITTMRHCLATADEPLTDANAQLDGAPCPAGKTTAYSAGNMHSPFDIDIPKSIEARVRIDSPHKGVTTTVWAHNDTSYCAPGDPATDDTGELDLVELWGTTYAQMSTFAGCQRTSDGKVHFPAYKPKVDPVDLPGQWHTYRVEYDGRAIRYFVDGRQATGPLGDEVTAETYRGTPSTADGIGQESMDRVMQDYLWRLVVGTKVYRTAGWAPHIADDEPFPVQRDLVDYIRVEQWDSASLPSISTTGDQAAAVGEVGTIHGTTSLPGATVRAEVQLEDGTWSVSRVGTAGADGSFALPLTYHSERAGSVRYRVTTTSPEGFWVSSHFTITRDTEAHAPTISTAGKRAVGITSYAWGSTGLPDAEVFTQVRVGGAWSTSQVRRTDANGSYTIPLTYGMHEIGIYEFRVGVRTADGVLYSQPATLERIPTASTAGTKRVNEQTFVWGSTGRAGIPMQTEVQLADGTWSRSRVGVTDANGAYALPLTYGSDKPGSYNFRVVALSPTGPIASKTVTLIRVR